MAGIKSIADDVAKIVPDATLKRDNPREVYEGMSSDELIRRLRLEELVNSFHQFNVREATVIGMAILELWSADHEKRSNSEGITVVITLFDGVTLFASSIGKGVSADNFEWARRKANTVKRFGMSSWMRGQTRLAKGKPADDPLLGPDYASHGGAIAIRIKGCPHPIGTIAVSGLTQLEDHGYIQMVVSSYLQRCAPKSSDAAFYTRDMASLPRAD